MTKPATRFALLLGLLCPALAACGLLPVAEAADPQLNLPGMTVNVAERYVDLEATVCLDESLLDLVTCRKGTKEHESIVAVEALPMHIHTALLVLGATDGHPAMRQPREPPATGWIDIPPEGDPIEVSLMLPDTDGQPVEHRISEFVAPAGLDSDGAAGDGGDGPRTFLADESGSVISIATFGDELLCLEGMHGQASDALLWQVNPDSLPPVGTKVTLRLRFRKPDAEAPADPPA